jgi:hypothetical protein
MRPPSLDANPVLDDLPANNRHHKFVLTRRQRNRYQKRSRPQRGLQIAAAKGCKTALPLCLRGSYFSSAAEEVVELRSHIGTARVTR